MTERDPSEVSSNYPRTCPLRLSLQLCVFNFVCFQTVKVTATQMETWISWQGLCVRLYLCIKHTVTPNPALRVVFI